MATPHEHNHDHGQGEDGHHHHGAKMVRKGVTKKQRQLLLMDDKFAMGKDVGAINHQQDGDSYGLGQALIRQKMVLVNDELDNRMAENISKKR